MSEDFRLPDLGEGLPDAELVQWLVHEGDVITLNQTIAEVETAKAVVELPSPYAGVVRSLHAAEGDVVAVGSLLISIDTAGSAPGGIVASPAASAETAEPAEERVVPNLVGYGAAVRSSARPQRRARVAHGAAPSGTTVIDRPPHDVLSLHEEIDASFERPRSTPPVRKLAKDLGIDLALVEASGAAGIITRTDLQAYAERVGAARAERTDVAAASSKTEARTTRIPIRGVRKHTAEAMVQSAFTAPHVTVFLTVDVTATTELVASLKADRALGEHRIGVLAVVAKAACLALGRTPSLNARWDEAAAEIVEHHYVNLGIAAATERGLVVPHIRDADAMSLIELADAIGELAATARAGRTSPADMRGGTFSISNVGVFGVDAGTPIINPGEAGILALGAVCRRPWEYRGEIALRDVLTLSLSFDHRLVDGQQGARFLSDVGDILREPGRAMLLR
ncbi:MAG: 2-oxo acid dehydrogenase subunit E2 [Actinobacteria bacterium]|nr:2-oxo acid dehydrogenase subunit E2 [Actinomycetota bacterium]